MNFDCVIFDFNGTLFFDDDKHVAAWNQISEEIRGLGITPKELHENINGVPNQQTITFLSGGTYTPEQEEFYSQKKEAVYREKCLEYKKNFHLVDGSEEYFDYLKEQNIPFTIATASIKPNVDFFIDSFHLDRWIPRKNFIYDDGTYENKVAMFQDACRILGSDPEHSLIFEDSGSGIRNAYESGGSNFVIRAGQKVFAECEGNPGVKKIIRSFGKMLPP